MVPQGLDGTHTRRRKERHGEVAMPGGLEWTGGWLIKSFREPGRYATELFRRSSGMNRSSITRSVKFYSTTRAVLRRSIDQTEAYGASLGLNIDGD